MEVVIAKKTYKEINKLSEENSTRIYAFLMKLKTIPPRSKGKALKGKFKTIWRYRVGDFRIFADIQDEILTILVVKISHRSKAY